MTAPVLPLFNGESAPTRPEPFCAWEVVARRKAGGDPAWQWCEVEAADGTGASRDCIVRGGVPNGGRRGRGAWKGVALSRVVVVESKMAAAEAEYERATGQCHRCVGTGETSAGWSAEHGHRYRPCARCGATGRAPESTHAA